MDKFKIKSDFAPNNWARLVLIESIRICTSFGLILAKMDFVKVWKSVEKRKNFWPSGDQDILGIKYNLLGILFDIFRQTFLDFPTNSQVMAIDLP